MCILTHTAKRAQNPWCPVSVPSAAKPNFVFGHAPVIAVLSKLTDMHATSQRCYVLPQKKWLDSMFNSDYDR